MFERFYILYFSKDKIIFLSFLLSFLSIITLLIFFFSTFKNLPEKIPLFYSHPWGENQLGSTYQFLLLPCLLTLFLLINLIISWYIHESQLTLKRIFALCSLAISIFISLTGLKIIYIFI